MRRAYAVWSFVDQHLSKGEPVGLLVVASASAGSPGRPGFALALDTAGVSVGTVGGGAMERGLVGEYADRLRTGASFRDLRRLVHIEQPRRGEPSGLRCGGSQTLCAISMSAADLEVVGETLEGLRSGRPAGITISGNGLACGTDGGCGLVEEDGGWVYRDPLVPAVTVLIVGGGHVGSALASLLQTLDMHVIVADERENLATTDIVAFPEVGSLVVDPTSTFAVVMTSAVSCDIQAVRALLPMGLAYLGVMGTPRKLRIIGEALTAEERSEMVRQAVRAPVGLDIGSHSPEEIAVSVAAQIIAVRNGRDNSSDALVGQ